MHSKKASTRPLTRPPEERAAGGQDQTVGPRRVPIADQRHVKEVVLLPDGRHSGADVRVEVVPLEAELLGGHAAAAAGVDGGCPLSCCWPAAPHTCSSVLAPLCPSCEDRSESESGKKK